MRNHRRALHPRAAGFTLLEVLVTLVVFSVALLGLLSLQTAALKMNQNAMSRSVASQYAYAMLDILRNDWRTARTNAYNTALVKVSDTTLAANGGDTAKTVRARWVGQLKSALPNSKVQICRRGNARAETESAPVTSKVLTGDDCKVDAPTDSLDYFVVRIDWEEAQTSDATDEPGAEKRAALNSIKVVAYLPEQER